MSKENNNKTWKEEIGRIRSHKISLEEKNPEINAMFYVCNVLIIPICYRSPTLWICVSRSMTTKFESGLWGIGIIAMEATA
jgi:hypothetical protein